MVATIDELEFERGLEAGQRRRRVTGSHIDFTLEEDIKNALKSVPKIGFALIPNVFAGRKQNKRVNVDAFGRLLFRGAANYSDSITLFLENFQPKDPIRKRFWEQVRLLDLNNQSYIEPFIDHTDEAIKLHLKGFMAKVKRGEDATADYDAFQERIDIIRESVRSEPIPDSQYAIKKHRVKAMLDYIDLLSKRAEAVQKACEDDVDLTMPGVRYPHDYLVQMVKDQHMRETGMLNNQPAPVEHLRKLKRCIAERYINEYERQLPEIVAEDKASNDENYALSLFGAGLLDDNETPVPDGDRVDSWRQKIAGDIAMLYKTGREHDALRALYVNMCRIGAGSKALIPLNIMVDVEKDLENTFEEYGIDIKKDKHFQHFKKRAKNVLTRDHSPEADGPRDTNDEVMKFLSDFMAGRMYTGMDESFYNFIATPLSNKRIHIPIYKFGQKVAARYGGGTVVPIDSPHLKRKAKGAAEKEGKHAIVWNSSLPWKWRDVETKEDSPFYNKNSFVDRAPWYFSMAMRPFTDAGIAIKHATYGNKYAIGAWGMVTMAATPLGPFVLGAIPVVLASPVSWPFVAGGLGVIGMKSFWNLKDGLKAKNALKDVKRHQTISFEEHLEKFPSEDKSVDLETLGQDKELAPESTDPNVTMTSGLEEAFTKFTQRLEEIIPQSGQSTATVGADARAPETVNISVAGNGFAFDMNDANVTMTGLYTEHSSGLGDFNTYAAQLGVDTSTMENSMRTEGWVVDGYDDADLNAPEPANT